MENWKTVAYAKNYEISDLGRLRFKGKSLVRENPRRKGATQEVHIKPKILNGWDKYTNGRITCVMVALRSDGKTINKRLHNVVLEAFVGDRPENMEGCHNDGNPLNNTLPNLRWDTHIKNIADSIRHGTASKPPVHIGSNHPNAAANELIAAKIKSIRDWPYGKQREIAERFGISEKVVSDIRYNKTWNHVKAA